MVLVQPVALQLMGSRFKRGALSSGRQRYYDKFIFSACEKLWRYGNDCDYKSHALDNSQRTLQSSRSIILNIKQTRNNIYYTVRAPAEFCSLCLVLIQGFIHLHRLTGIQTASEVASHVTSSDKINTAYELGKMLIRPFNDAVSATACT